MTLKSKLCSVEEQQSTTVDTTSKLYKQKQYGNLLYVQLINNTTTWW